jgi:1-acyl-sn-glycerol-3-phosphate acyltransferase
MAHLRTLLGCLRHAQVALQRRGAAGIEAPVQTTHALRTPVLAPPRSDERRRAAFASHLRATSRALALIALSLVAGGVCALALGVERVAPQRGSALRRGAARAWAHGSACILGMRVRVEGVAPAAPCLLVANHLSYIDVVTIWCATGGSFIAKSEVASWPLIGALGRIAQTLFIDRDRKRDVTRLLGEIERTLARGESVILFGEGTSTRGDRVLPFKSSLFEVAARDAQPVACASLFYATQSGAPPSELAVCWWGDMTFADHAYGLMKLRGFDATLRFAAEPVSCRDRKELALRAHAAVLAAWSPSAPAVRA